MRYTRLLSKRLVQRLDATQVDALARQPQLTRKPVEDCLVSACGESPIGIDHVILHALSNQLLCAVNLFRDHGRIPIPTESGIGEVAVTICVLRLNDRDTAPRIGVAWEAVGSALEARIAATVHAVSEALDSLPQLQAGGLQHERPELAGAQVFEGVAHCGSLAVRRRLGPGARPLAHRLRARPTTVE